MGNYTWKVKGENQGKDDGGGRVSRKDAGSGFWRKKEPLSISALNVLHGTLKYAVFWRIIWFIFYFWFHIPNRRVLNVYVCARSSVSRLTVAMCFMKKVFLFKMYFLWIWTKLIWRSRVSTTRLVHYVHAATVPWCVCQTSTYKWIVFAKVIVFTLYIDCLQSM